MECLVYCGADSDLGQHYSVCPGGGALSPTGTERPSDRLSVHRARPPQRAAQSFVRDLSEPTRPDGEDQWTGGSLSAVCREWISLTCFIF